MDQNFEPKIKKTPSQSQVTPVNQLSNSYKGELISNFIKPKVVQLNLTKDNTPQTGKNEEKEKQNLNESDIKDFEDAEVKVEKLKIIDQQAQDKIIDEIQKHIQVIYIDKYSNHNDLQKVDDIYKKWQNLSKRKLGTKSIGNSEFIDLFQNGIPSKLRTEVWRKFLPNRLSITKSFYKMSLVRAESYLKSKQIRELNIQNMKISKNSNLSASLANYSQDIDITDLEECKLESMSIVDVDIERTFTYLNGFGKTGILGKMLRNVLISFASSRPDIGYLQGMSYICGVFAIFFNEFETFIHFSNFISLPSIMPFYFLDEKTLAQKYQIFKNIFHSNLPNLCDHFETEGVHPRMYMIQWLITIYSNTLNLQCVCLIWDFILLDGGGLVYFYKAGVGKIFLILLSLISYLFKAMLSIIEEKLLYCDFEGIMMKLGKLSEYITDPIILSKKILKVQVDDWMEEEIKSISYEFQDF